MGAACTSEQVYPYVEGSFEFLGPELATREEVLSCTSAALSDNQYVVLYFGKRGNAKSQIFSKCLAPFFEEEPRKGRVKAACVYVSMDANEIALENELKEFPWLAIPYKNKEREGVIQEYCPKGADGAPYVVVFNGDGSVLKKDAAVFMHNGVRNTVEDFLNCYAHVGALSDRFHEGLESLLTGWKLCKACRKITHPWHWDFVREQFKADHPDLCGGDLELAMKEKLGPKNYMEAEGILAAKRVFLQNEEQRADGRAALMYKAMKGAGTDEDLIYILCSAVTTQREWELLRASFLEHYPDFEEGDLFKALRSEFSDSDMGRAEWILEQRRIRMRAVEEDVVYREQQKLPRLDYYNLESWPATGTIKPGGGVEHTAVQEMSAPDGTTEPTAADGGDAPAAPAGEDAAPANSAEEDKAATKIQKMHRGRQARKEVKKRRAKKAEAGGVDDVGES